jgi:hypothetical protein
MEKRQEVINWLMDSDPAIRWQVMKDILHCQPTTWSKERSRLTQSGWCARLLQFQDKSGLWNHSLYNGKWLSTTYSLYLLKTLGLPPGNLQALRGCALLLAQGLYQQKEIRFSRNKNIKDLGVSAIVLSLCCYFGYDAEALARIAEFLVSQQSNEGNWLPDEEPSASDYAFETTLLVLEALLQYQNRYEMDLDTALPESVQKGQEFLLRYNLGLGEQRPIKNKWTSFSFPPYWFYDILTALDYFCAFRTNKDKRFQLAIDLLRHKQKGGQWLLGFCHAGKTYFEMEVPGGPSRWNTLRAIRVLEWWDGG